MKTHASEAPIFIFGEYWYYERIWKKNAGIQGKKYLEPLLLSMRNGFGKDAKGFSGNKTNTLFRVDIFYSETGGIGGGLFFQASRASNVTFDSVTFSNGNATKSWNDGY